MKEGLNDRSNHCSIISVFFTISLLVLMGYTQFHGFKVLKPITSHLCWLSHATIGRLMKSPSLVGRWNETIFGNPSYFFQSSLLHVPASLKIRTFDTNAPWHLHGAPIKMNLLPWSLTWPLKNGGSFPVWDGMPNTKRASMLNVGVTLDSS